MPRSRIFTSEYKDNLKVNNLSSNTCKVNRLEVYDNTTSEHKDVLDIALENVDSNFGIPGVIRGESDNKIIRQIVTPNDRDSNEDHIYKHVVNDALLYEIDLRDTSNSTIQFNSMYISFVKL